MFSLLSHAPGSAQRRPALRPARRDYFAGKLVLIPRDARPKSWLQPRLIAEVADHDLLIPPLKLLEDSRKLSEWAGNIDYDEIDGAIVSLNAIAARGPGETVRERLSWLREARARRPKIPIYLFVEIGAPAGSTLDLVQPVIGMIAEGVVDYLLISDGAAGVNQDQGLAAKLREELAGRRIEARVAFDGNSDSAATLLIGRFLNCRFGFSPKVLPVYSLNAARENTDKRKYLQLVRSVSAGIRAIDADEAPQRPGSARNVEILLFIHTPQTSEAERRALIDTIVQVIERNVRVAIADVSDEKAGKEFLLAELRRRKLFDRLAGFASTDLDKPQPAETVNRALAQASSFLVSIRFLRDDLDRVRRIDRAQVNLLLNRYLSDWVYPVQVRPKLAGFTGGQSKTQSDQPYQPNQPDQEEEDDRLESIAVNQLRPPAEEFFNEQFRRNLHAILLSNGERAQFELRLLQRLSVRLARPSLEAEIKPSIYEVYLGNVPTSRLPSRTLWDLLGDDLDERVARRWDAIEWVSFKTDVNSVEMRFRISTVSNGAAQNEGYQIRSKRSRDVRRIEIVAPSWRGAFYALGKLEQMGAEGRLAQDFQVGEAPAFERRGVIEVAAGYWSHRDRLEALRFLGRVRMNRYYYAPESESLSGRGQSGEGIDKLQELLRVADENFVQVAYGIRPGSSFNYAMEGSIDDLLRRLEEPAAAGIKGFLLCLDHAPGRLQTDAERRRFNSLAAAHAHLVNRVLERLKQITGGIELTVLPGPLAGSDTGSDYLNQLAGAIPAEVQILAPAAGAESVNRRFDLLDQQAAISAVSGVGQICLRPYKGAPLNLSAGLNGLIVNAGAQLQFDMPRLATAADYAWESGSYLPENAFNRALALLFDEHSREGIRLWRSRAGDCSESLRANADQTNEAAELQSALEMILGTRDRGLIRGELARLKRQD